MQLALLTPKAYISTSYNITDLSSSFISSARMNWVTSICRKMSNAPGIGSCNNCNSSSRLLNTGRVADTILKCFICTILFDYHNTLWEKNSIIIFTGEEIVGKWNLLSMVLSLKNGKATFLPKPMHPLVWTPTCYANVPASLIHHLGKGSALKAIIIRIRRVRLKEKKPYVEQSDVIPKTMLRDCRGKSD